MVCGYEKLKTKELVDNIKKLKLKGMTTIYDLSNSFPKHSKTCKLTKKQELRK